MATPPTRVVGVTPAVGWASTASPKTSPAFDVVNGDLITILSFSEDQTRPLNTPTWTGTGTITARQSVVVANYCTAYLYTIAVTATATGVTISQALTSTAGQFSFYATVWRNHGGLGVTGKTNVASGAPALTLATSANSAVVCGNSDWTATDPTGHTWRTVNGAAMTESSQGGQVGATYETYTGYAPDTGAAGSTIVGLTSPSAQKYSIVGAEVLGTAGSSSFSGSVALAGAGTLANTGTPAIPGANTLTGGGTLTNTGRPANNGSAALAGTGSLANTGAPAIPGTAAPAGAGTLTLTGTLTAQGGAGLAGTGTLTLSGSASGSASGTLTLGGTGTLTTTATVSTSGNTTPTGTGTLALTGTTAATGTLALTGTGTLTLTGTAAGNGSGTLNLAGTGTLAGTGQPATTGPAAPSGTGTLALAGKPATNGNATYTATGTLTLTGKAGPGGALTLTGTGTLTATGTAGGIPVDVTFTAAALTDRWSSMPLAGRWTITAMSDRFTPTGLTERWISALTDGDTMTTDILISAGAKKYVGCTITETTGKDISSDVFQISLGSATNPGTWATPDINTPGTTPNIRTVKLLVSATTPAGITNGCYYAWVRITDNPEIEPIRVQGPITIR